MRTPYKININEAIIDFIKLNNKAHIDLEKWLFNGTYLLDDLLVIIKNINSDKYIYEYSVSWVLS